MFDCHLFASDNHKKDGRQKCQSLEYQFEQTMEFGDASDEEASCCDLNKTDLLNNQHLEAISMLVMNAMKDCLKRGSVMAMTKRFDMAHSTIHILWKQAECMHVTGVINSPKLYSQKKIPGEFLSICLSSLSRVSRVYH